MRILRFTLSPVSAKRFVRLIDTLVSPGGNGTFAERSARRSSTSTRHGFASRSGGGPSSDATHAD